MTIRRPAQSALLVFSSVLAALALLASSPLSPASPEIETASAWEVYFSPRGGATEAIVATLAKAQSTVLVQAYSFTSAPIARALLEAHTRGLNVEVILDKSQRSERYSSADFLVRAGIPVQIDAAHAIAHNKVMVIDGTTVITGSFNFTRAAEDQNAENLLIIHDPALAAQYAANWHAHAQHSEPYRGK